MIEAKEKNGEESSFSDALKMNYYLITEKVRCENCLRSVTVPIYTGHSNLILWKEYYPKCDNSEYGWHSFDAVDGSERYLELMECSEDEKGIVYFKNHWWKIKSDQFVYIRHLREDKRINQKYYDDY